MPETIESYGRSVVGRVRHNNEDVFDAVLEKNFFVLADGMGGHNAGEVAALEAVKNLCDIVRQTPPSLSAEEWSHCLRIAVKKTNERIWKMSLSESAYAGMGTTLCCFLIHEESLIYAHVGDSRLYRYREGLEQLTKDHSLRSALLAEGGTQEEINAFKNIITRAVGTNSHVVPDTGILPVLPNDTYLLCSDGLTDLVSDTEIASILSLASSLEEAARICIETALEKGGNDNVTVVLVRRV